MPPGVGGADKHGCTVHECPLSTDRRGRDEDAPPHPPPPFPATEVSLEMKKKPPPPQQPPQPVAYLPADLVLEILSRVPYKSLCRFKCVSKPWLGFCSDPKVRKRSLQSMSGFFFNKSSCGLSFRNLSRRGAPVVDPSLPFLRRHYRRVEVEHCSGGLLLCKYYQKSCRGRNRNKKKYGFAVCNPVTGQWNVLPDPMTCIPLTDDHPEIYEEDIGEFFLGFDAANPSGFVVFAPLNNNSSGAFEQVIIFSSETQWWIVMDNDWGYETVLAGKPECALLNDTMHFATHDGTGRVVTLDMKDRVWGEIEMPDDRHDIDNYTSIRQSQGCLYAWQIDNYDRKLCVWVLGDYGSGKWTLKHIVNVSELFGRQFDKDKHYYKMFAIHPDCNLVFLKNGKGRAVSYDMDNQKVSVISTSIRIRGWCTLSLRSLQFCRIIVRW